MPEISQHGAKPRTGHSGFLGQVRRESAGDSAAMHGALVCALGAVVGTAAQVWGTARLWEPLVYAALGLGAGLLGMLMRGRVRAWANLGRWAWWFVLAALVAFGSAGYRAARLDAQAMPAAWQGRDVWVRGVVDGLPQYTLDGGLRWVMAVQSMQLMADGSVLFADDGVPARVALSLRDARALNQPLVPGQHWAFVARLRSPLGTANAQGLDVQLWWRQQGVRARGYVRTDAAGAARAQWLGDSYAAPLQRLRSQVRQRMWAAMGGRPVWGDASDGDDGDGSRRAVTRGAQPGGAADGGAHMPSGSAPNAMGLSQPIPRTGHWGIFGQVEPAEDGGGEHGWADAVAVVVALVTGDQAAMPPRLWKLWREAGVVHLVSISGLHITMFAWVAMVLVRVMWARSARLCAWMHARMAGLWMGLGLAAVYAAFSGWGLPAQRTMAMLAVVVVMRTLGLRWSWPVVWAVVLAVVVLWQPLALTQPGLWLSFVAVGILFAAGHEDPEDESRALRLSVLGHMAAWLRQLIRTQLLLSAALAPVMVLAFGQMSVVGVLVNVLAVPWVTLLVTPLAMLGMVAEPLWGMAAACVVPLLMLLKWALTMPAAVAHFAQPPLWAAVAAVLACVWGALPLPWALRSLAAPLVLPALLWRPAAPGVGEFEVTVLDVGQGAATIVRTAQHTLLIDAGPRWSSASDAGEAIVVPHLRGLGIARLDAMLLSHGDGDHVGGAASVLEAMPTTAILGGAGVREAVQHSTVAMHEAQNIADVGQFLMHIRTKKAKDSVSSPVLTDCRAGQRWRWDSVEFHILHPQPHDAQLLGSHYRNQGSCVMLVRAAHGAAAVFAGDISRAQERAIIARTAQQPDALRVDLSLAAHHGSHSASSAAWVQATAASTVVFQTALANRFGHPHASVQQRWAAAGAVLRDTGRCGSVHWSSTQPRHSTCFRQDHPRYWHEPRWGDDAQSP